MKKSIKYAGVAAATLLAVAPVAAPVLTNVTTVQAALGDGTNEITASQISSAVSNLNSVLTNTSFGTSDSAVSTTFPKLVTDGASNDAALSAANYGKYIAYKGSDSTSEFTSSALYTNMNKNVTTSNDAVLSNEDVATQVKTVAVDKDGKALANSDFLKIANDVQTNGGSISFQSTVKHNTLDEDGNVVTGKEETPVTYTLTYDKAATEDATTGLSATYTTPYTVAPKSKTLNAQLTTSTDVALKDQNGKDVKTSVSMGSLYNTLAGAKAETTSDVFSDANFGETGTYYQPITVTASGLTTNTVQQIVNGYIAGTDGYSLSVNGETPSPSDVAAYNATDNTITFIREVHVSDAAAWTTTDESGVVTTKNDKTYYTLKNDDNKTISNRALAANTSWQYDKVRTNANGDKQYRVSTHEWVPAESVNVNDGNNNGGSETPEGALTVTNLDTKKVVNLATPGMTYFVYNKDGVMSTTRALAGGSSWLVDKTATDAAGNMYYGVSTDEFVKAGEGVSLAD